MRSNICSLALAFALAFLAAPPTVRASCVGGHPNGTRQGPEQCDDGNLSDTDACLSDCTFAFCGDAFTHVGVEECDGSACCDPTCHFSTGGTECRPAAGSCDVAEICSGTSGDCPADVRQPASTECRAATDACDVAEVCDGTSPACPPDALKPAGAVCRPAAHSCDVAETCNGTSAACPADVVKAPGALCRAAAGPCDREEYCDATSTCPADILKLAGDTCRTGAGPCDETDVCDGSSAACVDEKKPSTFVCRAQANDCDVEELCTGTSNDCPTNAFVAKGTSCDDGNPCTLGDTCSATGVCVGQSCVDDGNSCTNDRCDAMAGCVHDPVTDGVVCDDSDPCTNRDTCTGGICSGIQTDADTDGDGYCDFQEEQAGCNVDDANEIPPQATTFGGRLSGSGDVLLTYAVPSDGLPSPASDRSCATTGKCGRFGTCNATTHKCADNAAVSCMADTDCVLAARGFCTAGKVADPCIANTDCDLPADTCRVVVNFAAVDGLKIDSATLNRRVDVLPAMTPATPGCSRKFDLVLDPSRRVNRLRLRAHSATSRDRDTFRYR